jgi:hypothetical protein
MKSDVILHGRATLLSYPKSTVVSSGIRMIVRYFEGCARQGVRMPDFRPCIRAAPALRESGPDMVPDIFKEEIRSGLNRVRPLKAFKA